MKFRPKGPLYTLRLSQGDFDALGKRLREQLRFADPGRVRDEIAAAFCVFAAEWWRRNHEGGAWRWGGIQEALGIPDVHHNHLREWTRRGLHELGRGVVQLDGANLYLVSLATEGGLPLKLVQRQGNRLNTFFGALFEHLEATGQREPAERGVIEIARNRAYLLPRALRQAPVFLMAGQLAARLWPRILQVAEQPHPVRWLDEHQPGWRDELPVQLDDEVARSFLSRLIDTGAGVARRTGELAVESYLRLDPDLDAWRLIRALSVPDRVSERDAKECFSEHADAPALRLRLLGAERDAVVAMLRRYQGDLFAERVASARIRDDDGPIEVEVASAQGPPALIDVPGAMALGELPWTFRRRDRSWALVATGSCRVPDDVVALALPVGAEVVEGEVEDLGEIVGLDRRLVEARGTVRVRTVEGEVEVRLRQAVDAAGERYTWVGRRFSSARSRRPLFHGWPQLRLQGAGLRGVEFDVRGPDGWQRPGGVWGDVLVRRVVEGRLAMLQRVQVLPDDLIVTLEVGESQGRVGGQSSNLIDAGIAVPGVDVRRTRQGRAVSLEVRAGEGARPTVLPLRLELRGGRPVTVQVPCPLVVREFVGRDGSALPVDHVAHIEDLGGIRVQVTEPTARDHFLEAVLDGTDTKRTFRVGRGERVSELDLRTIQDDLRAMFAQSLDLDCKLGLSLFTPGPMSPPRRIVVRRYDWLPSLDKPAGQVVIDAPGVDADTRVEVRTFGAPARVEALQRVPGEAHRWRFDREIRLGGAWLITARRGEWHHGRPTLWTVEGPRETEGLRGAFEISNPQERRAALRACLDTLVADGDHEDWLVLEDTLTAATDLPSTTFDVLDVLVTHPALAQVALRTTWREPSEALAVLAALGELPLCWMAIPRVAWWAAFDVLYQAAEEDEEGSGLQDLVRAVSMLRTTVELDGLLVHWCRARGLEVPRSLDSVFEAVLSNVELRSFLLEDRHDRLDDLIRSHDDDHQWPTPPVPVCPDALRMRHPALEQHHKERIAHAPVSAAHAVVSRRSMPGLTEVRAWRQAHDFDPHFFREVWRRTLAVALVTERS